MRDLRGHHGVWMWLSVCCALGACNVDDPGIMATNPGGRTGSAPPPGTGGTGGPPPGDTAPFTTVTFSDAGPSSMSMGAGGSGPNADDKNCGFSKFALERRPAELLVVLDKSGSMDQTVFPGGQKWSSVTSALDTVVMRTQDAVHWGLKLYPSDNSCAVNDGVNLDLALGSHMRLAALIAMTRPGGNTPTRLAVEKATAHLKARQSPNPKYILLATDGQPNCLVSGSRTQDDPAGAVAAVAAAATAGFHTFVVGVATTGSSAHTTLNQMADKGLEPRQDPMTRYYPVASRDEFIAVLESITGTVASCQFTLMQTPPSPNDVAVDVAGMRAPRDRTRTDGWDYGDDMKSVSLYGSWCDRLKAAMTADVKITFGCPNVVIP